MNYGADKELWRIVKSHPACVPETLEGGVRLAYDRICDSLIVQMNGGVGIYQAEKFIGFLGRCAERHGVSFYDEAEQWGYDRPRYEPTREAVEKHPPGIEVLYFDYKEPPQ